MVLQKDPDLPERKEMNFPYRAASSAAFATGLFMSFHWTFIHLIFIHLPVGKIYKQYVYVFQRLAGFQVFGAFFSLHCLTLVVLQCVEVVLDMSN